MTLFYSKKGKENDDGISESGSDYAHPQEARHVDWLPQAAGAGP